jgi:hypothetical protein
MLVSSTAFRTGRPHGCDGVLYVPLDLFRGNLRQAAPDAIQRSKAKLALRDQPLIDLKGDDDRHRPARAFHDDHLALAIHPAQQTGKSVTSLLGLDPHWSHPILPSSPCFGL